MGKFYKYLGFVIFIVIFSVTHSIQAQGRYGRTSIFSAGITAGVNAAQVDGDLFVGYRRLGFQGGLQAFVRLDQNLYLSTEFLFSQQGAMPSEAEKKEAFRNYMEMRLNYVEVPVLLNFHLGKQKEGYKSLKLIAGASVGRLVSHQIRLFGTKAHIYPLLELEDLGADLTTTDINFILGLQTNFSQNFGLYIRYANSLTNLYTPGANFGNLKPLNPYHITFGVSYVFFSYG